MVQVTERAEVKLKILILEHPEDPIVRLTVRDIDETKVSFSITLESDPQPDDEIQECKGLTIAVEGQSAARMDGITLDYNEPGGFAFLHPGHGAEDLLGIINPN